MFTSEYDLNDEKLSIYAELWASMKSFVPSKDRLDAASQFMSFLIDNGVVRHEDEMDDLYGSCSILDKAIVMLRREMNADDEVNEDEEFDGY